MNKVWSTVKSCKRTAASILLYDLYAVCNRGFLVYRASGLIFIVLAPVASNNDLNNMRNNCRACGLRGSDGALPPLCDCQHWSGPDTDPRSLVLEIQVYIAAEIHQKSLCLWRLLLLLHKMISADNPQTDTVRGESITATSRECNAHNAEFATTRTGINPATSVTIYS